MAYGKEKEKIAALQKQINQLRTEVIELRRSQEAEAVQNYSFQTANGPVDLMSLFGDKDELMVIHNMGSTCTYCTLWADGFNGVIDHLENRAAFVVSSPENPEAQKKFAESRGWKFQMISTEGTTFVSDMGYKKDDYVLPGVSVFRKKGDQIFRVSDESFGPGDDYCHVWHLFDLFPEKTDWAPKYRYQ